MAPLQNVLLTYAWVRSSYGALRNLSKNGVPVYVADTNRSGMSQWSRFSRGSRRYTSHYENEAQFVADIVRLCDQDDVALVFPSHNETEILARHKDVLGDQRSRLLPDPEHCALFNNKSAAYDFALALGVPVPRRFQYEKPAELTESLRASGGGRFVIKLLTGNSAKGVFYADSPEAVVKRVSALISEHELGRNRYPQVEEVVPGEGWGCSVLYWRGRRIADFTHRRLREKIETGGTSTLREAATHAGVREAANRIFEAIGWHGLAMCEFKVCPLTGKFWFIEVNPRMWGSIPLAISAGVEFPYLAYVCATAGPDAAIALAQASAVKLGYRGKWLLGDLFVVAKELVRLRPGRAVSMLTERVDAYDDFYLDDMPAFLGEMARYLSTSLSKRSLNPAEKGMVG